MSLTNSKAARRQQTNQTHKDRSHSTSDLGNSFEIVKGMKPVPFGKETLLQLAVISLAPVAPLVLTMIPLGELLDRFLKIVF